MSHAQPAAGDFGGYEAERRELMMRMPTFERAFRGRRTALDDLQLARAQAAPAEAVAPRRRAAAARRAMPRVVAPPSYAYVAAEPDGNLPVQGAVDRTEQLAMPTVDIEIPDEDGGIAEILRFPINLGYGPNPSDPPGFSEHVDPQAAICGILAPYAAIRCLAAGGAW